MIRFDDFSWESSQVWELILLAAGLVRVLHSTPLHYYPPRYTLSSDKVYSAVAV